MTQEHTPKWIVDIEVPIALLEEGVPTFFDYPIEKVIEITTADHSETIGYARDDETAQLFAAAPETATERDRLREINKELLAAAKISLRMIEYNESPNHKDGCQCGMCELRRAIAKADTSRNKVREGREEK